MKLKVKEGENRFEWMGFPLPNIPSFGTGLLDYRFRLGSEWFTDEPLTKPLIYGVKLPAIGAYDYHKLGANFALVKEQGKIIMYPRFYKNYVLTAIRSCDVILEPDKWYYCELMIYDEGEFCWSVFDQRNNPIINHEELNLKIKSHWLTIQPFIGTMGNPFNGRVVAYKDLGMEVKFI